MKSLHSSVITFAPLLIAVVALAVGWIGRGLFALLPTAPQAVAPPTAEISSSASRPVVSATVGQPGDMPVEEPKAVAMRLLKAVLEELPYEESEVLLKFRFRGALAGCDEPAVAEMLEVMMRYAKEMRYSDSDMYHLPSQLGDLVLARMDALNSLRGLEWHIALAREGMSGEPENFALVMALLAEQNPAQVQKMIEDLPPGGVRTSAQFAWLDARSKSDPEGVFQSLMNLDSEAKDSLRRDPAPLVELLWKLALQAPEKALQVAALFPEERCADIRQNLLGAWLQRDPKVAVKWAIEQNDAGALMACLRNLPPENRDLDEKSLRDNFLALSSKQPAYRVSLAGELAERLAEQDIPEGVRWAATLPADVREVANLVVAEAWINQDVPAAAEWLATWPAGEFRDQAVQRLTEAMVKDDPESALAWAASIQTKRRYGLMQKALDTLTGKDPADAERAMQTLSEEDRALLSFFKSAGLGE